MIKNIIKIVLLISLVTIVYFITIYFSDNKLNKINKIIIYSDSTFLDKKIIKDIFYSNLDLDTTKINFYDIENNFKLNPYVKDIKVYSDLVGNVIIDLDQYKPLARISSGIHSKKYFDIDGEIFPSSTKYSDRVMLIHLSKKINLNGKNINNTQFGKDLMKMIKYINEDNFLRKIISEIEIDNHKNIIIHPQLSKQKIIFGYPDDFINKFDKVDLFYKKIAPLKGWNTYMTVNVKYQNQIICDKNT